MKLVQETDEPANLNFQPMPFDETIIDEFKVFRSSYEMVLLKLPLMKIKAFVEGSRTVLY